VAEVEKLELGKEGHSSLDTTVGSPRSNSGVGNELGAMPTSSWACAAASPSSERMPTKTWAWHPESRFKGVGSVVVFGEKCQSFGFVVRAIGHGGLDFEDNTPETLAEAMAVLEAGLARWFEEQD